MRPADCWPGTTPEGRAAILAAEEREGFEVMPRDPGPTERDLAGWEGEP